ncbi:MAG: ABC transporter substrate-binding protein, partial [Candidatus Baldrarchaeia archaeon]
MVPGFLEGTGEAAEYLFDTGSGQPTDITPKGASFTEAYKAKWGTAPTYIGLAQYVSMQVMTDAIERAGSLDKEAIINALEQTDYSGEFLGRLVFSQNHEAKAGIPYRVYVAFQIQNGTIQVVWPDEYKTAEIKLPP